MSAPGPLSRGHVRSRRAVVLGGAASLVGLGAVGVASGCTAAGPDAPTPTGSGSGSSGSSVTAPPTGTGDTGENGENGGTSRDVALVEEVLTELATATGVVLAARRGAPRLRPDLHPLLVLHGEHVRLLGARLPVEPPGAAGRASARERLAAVRRRELRLQRVLLDAAVAADSGPLARLLASMAAAVAQRLVVLPTEPR